MNVCLFADEIKGVDKTHREISANEKEIFGAKAVPLMTLLCKKGADYGIQLYLSPSTDTWYSILCYCKRCNCNSATGRLARHPT